MKYKITEKKIKAIANGEADIRDLFPDVFEVKLEVGKVYKTNYVNEKGVKSKFMAYIQDVEKMKNYGFSFNGDFAVNMYFSKENHSRLSKENHSRLSEATQKEWEEALIKEADRKFEKGDYFADVHANNFVNIVDEIKYYKDSEDLRCSSGCLFHKGIWAKKIETITKKEAENKLKEFGYDCKIV